MFQQNRCCWHALDTLMNLAFSLLPILNDSIDTNIPWMCVCVCTRQGVALLHMPPIHLWHAYCLYMVTLVFPDSVCVHIRVCVFVCARSSCVFPAHTPATAFEDKVSQNITSCLIVLNLLQSSWGCVGGDKNANATSNQEQARGTRSRNGESSP